MPETWTAATAAAHCGVAESTWRKYVADRRAPAPLPGYDEHRRRRWDAEHVRVFHASRPGQGRRAVTPTDITAAISRPAPEVAGDWNWAETATAAWLAAATAAGLMIDGEDHEVYGEYTAARVHIAGRWYDIEMRGDDVAALDTDN